MADGYWASREGGTPESTIVRFMAGGTGYILMPDLVRASPFVRLIPAAYRPALLPLVGDEALIKRMPGFIGPTPLFQKDGNALVTAVIKEVGTVRGYFTGGAFVPFVVGGTVVIGAFRHRYTEGGAEKTRILSVKDDGSIVDTETNAALTTSGPGFSLPASITFQASADGRVLVLESKLTLGTPPLRNIRKVEVDFAGSPQAVFTDLAEAGPFGTDHLLVVGGQLTRTISGIYQSIAGVNEGGEIAHITFEEDTLIDGAVGATGTDILLGGTAGPVTVTRTETTQLTVGLPNGISHTFTLESSERTSTGSLSGVGPSRVIHLETEASIESSCLGIIYADPAVPILVYALHTTHTTVSAAANLVESVDWVESGTPTGTTTEFEGTVYHTRTVGMLVGNEHRVLFTETGGASFGSTVKTGFVTGGRVGQSILLYHAQGGDSEQTNPITTNKGYFKHLRLVECYFNGTSPVSKNLTTHDVGSGNFDADTEPSYWVAAKDVENWILGVFRRKDLDGNTLNAFNLYAGGLNEPALRQRYIDYMIEALQSAGTPDATAIADLQAGNLTPYRVELHTIASRIAMR